MYCPLPLKSLPVVEYWFYGFQTDSKQRFGADEIRFSKKGESVQQFLDVRTDLVGKNGKNANDFALFGKG